MKILKRLRIAGQAPAVLLSDDQEEYPVFLESLLVPTIMDELLSSGYQYCSLPYDFRLEGRRLTDLPEEDFTVTQDTLQSMYDMLGTQYTKEELSAKVVLTEDAFKEWPVGEYTIHNRKEFLEFLELSSAFKSEDDFLPLNYFVAPDALFTVDEWLSGEYSKYVQIIENRRRMPYRKFKRLVAWAQTKGLPEKVTPIEVIKFLFQWGIDGIYFPLLRVEELASRVPLAKPSMSLRDTSTLTKAAVNYYVTTHALVDRYNKFTIEERYTGQQYRWEPLSITQTELVKQVSGLAENEVKVQTMYMISHDTHVKLIGKDMDIQYSADVILFGNYYAQTYVVTSPDSTRHTLPRHLWLPNREEEVMENAQLYALTESLLSSRIHECNGSSLTALLAAGLSPYSAGVYWIHKAGLLPQSNTSKQVLDNENTLPDIVAADISDYLKGVPIQNEDIYETIDGFYNGIYNIDNVQAGEQLDSYFDREDVYKMLHCAHRIMGYSLEELTTIVESTSKDMDMIVLEKNGIVLKIKLPTLNNKQLGFEKDCTLYKLYQSQQAFEYCYITEIATECGTDQATRDVAVDMWVLGSGKKEKILLDALESEFLMTVEAKAHANTVPRWKAASRKYAAQHFFELALNGKYTYQDALGGATITVTAAEQGMYHSLLVSTVEGITALCDTMVDCDGKFQRYYLNATVYPDCVVPLTGYEIHKTRFNAVWEVGMRAHLTVLRQRGLVRDWQDYTNLMHLPNQQFIFWESRHLKESRLGHAGCYPMTTDIMFTPTTLYYYYKQAKEYMDTLPANAVFKSVPHPTEYLWPKYYAPETLSEDYDASDSIVLCDSPQNHKWFTGTGSFVKRDDVIDRVDQLFHPDDQTRLALTHKIAIKPFTGFTLDDFIYASDLKSFKYPFDGIAINPASDTTFYTLDDATVRDYTELANLSNEYAIRRIANRHYIFRDSSNSLWEVTI